MKFSTAFAGLLFFGSLEPAHGLEWSGNLGLEGRQFFESPVYPNQSDHPGLSGSLEIEFYQNWNESDAAFEFTPFFRWDSIDGQRTHGDIRELYFLKSGRDWELKVGISKVFWGVTESQHLVDIINQTDLVENPDGEDKLGQPMIQTTYIHNWGDFSLFVLPGFRERTFPGTDGRLRTPIPVDADSPLWESSAGESHVDVALRWKGIVGDFDIGAYFFKGTHRDPRLIPVFGEQGPERLRPYYDQINQTGMDLQYTKEGWLWKLEAIALSGTLQSHEAAVGGFEYTFYAVFGSDADIGTLMEYNYDSRGALSTNPFNRDLFAGTRITLNDERDTNLIAGVFWDRSNDTSSVRFEFERRISANYTLEIQFQAFTDIASYDPLFSFRRDSYLQVDLKRYF